MKNKERLSASIDADMLVAAEQAVSRGEAASVSAWVNDAFRLKIEHDRRLRALDKFIRAFEEIHGEITADEMQAASRHARGRAIVVRGTGPGDQRSARKAR